MMTSKISNAKTYWKGDRAEYTGKSMSMYGGVFFELKIVSGYMKGQIKWTQVSPSVGVK